MASMVFWRRAASMATFSTVTPGGSARMLKLLTLGGSMLLSFMDPNAVILSLRPLTRKVMASGALDSIESRVKPPVWLSKPSQFSAVFFESYCLTYVSSFALSALLNASKKKARVFPAGVSGMGTCAEAVAKLRSAQQRHGKQASRKAEILANRVINILRHVGIRIPENHTVLRIGRNDLGLVSSNAGRFEEEPRLGFEYLPDPRQVMIIELGHKVEMIELKPVDCSIAPQSPTSSLR